MQTSSCWGVPLPQVVSFHPLPSVGLTDWQPGCPCIPLGLHVVLPGHPSVLPLELRVFERRGASWVKRALPGNAGLRRSEAPAHMIAGSLLFLASQALLTAAAAL